MTADLSPEPPTEPVLDALGVPVQPPRPRSSGLLLGSLSVSSTVASAAITLTEINRTTRFPDLVLAAGVALSVLSGLTAQAAIPRIRASRGTRLARIIRASQFLAGASFFALGYSLA